MSRSFGSYLDYLSARGSPDNPVWLKILLAEAIHRDKMEIFDYVTPGDVHSLRFAAGEMFEFDDVELRRHGGYKRNNVRNHSLPEEIGDCLGMLAVARLVHARRGPQPIGDEERMYTLRLAGMMRALAAALMAAVVQGDPNGNSLGIDTISDIDMAAGSLLVLAESLGLDPIAAHVASRAKQEARWAKGAV
jgi:hypothetical protein